jgi:hypothetical protein
MILKCKHCGEDFKVTKEQEQNHEDGFCELPDTCMECFAMEQDAYAGPDEDAYGNNYSDADPGL